MRFKTVSTTVLATAMVFGVAACGETAEDAAPVETPEAVDTPDAAETEEAAPAEPVEEATPEPEATQEPTTISLLPTGLKIGGEKETTLSFGQRQDAVVTAVRAVLGSPEMGSNEECGAGPIQFATFDDLQLNFQDGKFAGWGADGVGNDVAIAGRNGLKIGGEESRCEQTRGL